MYGNNYQPQNNYQGGYQSPPKKRSGAKQSTISKGKSQGLIHIHAWNKSKKRGFVTVDAFEHKKSKRWQTPSGKRFVMLIFEVLFKDTGNKMVIPAPYCIDTGKAYLDQLGMVISTKAPNKGYFGTKS